MVPRLLAAGLPTGAVRLEAEVTEVTGSGVRTRTGDHIEASAVVIATDGTTAAALAPGLVPPGWHPVTTFYYRLPASPLGPPVMVIDGQDELLVNAAVLSDVASGYAPARRVARGNFTPGLPQIGA